MDRPRTIPRASAVAAAITLGLAFASCGGDDDVTAGESTEPNRQDEVAERGADVMPFDLDATTHRFIPSDDGLVETVTADDPNDTENVELIREHLMSERDRFRAGDYGDPAQIHGGDMPGLLELEAGAAEIDIVYGELADGARLTFASDNRKLVDALRRWGEAQVTDHGVHAQTD